MSARQPLVNWRDGYRYPPLWADTQHFNGYRYFRVTRANQREMRGEMGIEAACGWYAISSVIDVEEADGPFRSLAAARREMEGDAHRRRGRG